MKTILKILLILWILLSFFWTLLVNAKIVLPTNEIGSIEKNSIKIKLDATWNIVTHIEKTWISILKTIKLIFEWVLIIYIVYAWIQMILSMWSNEDELSKSKKSLRYSLIWIVFINIPWGLYNAFKQDNYWIIDWKTSFSSWVHSPWTSTNNILVNYFNFWETLNWDIIWFLEVILSTMAIIFIIISWINIIRSRWNEEEFTKARTKITWSIVWLVFIWFIEAWKSVIFSWNIADWKNLFETLANFALFFAWPIAIFFLTLAAYYYINSNSEDDRIKKAKNIVLNTVIATVVLLASYAFLLDLATL